MQTAGDRVAAAAELAAGVQRGQDDLDGRPLLHRVLVDRDAAAVVDRPGPPPSAWMVDVDGVAVAGQGLVDRVVHDLVDQVVQAALAGGADVHARALADRLEALEDLDRAGVVGVRPVVPTRYRSPQGPARSGRGLRYLPVAASLIANGIAPSSTGSARARGGGGNLPILLVFAGRVRRRAAQ